MRIEEINFLKFLFPCWIFFHNMDISSILTNSLESVIKCSECFLKYVIWIVDRIAENINVSFSEKCPGKNVNVHWVMLKENMNDNVS